MEIHDWAATSYVLAKKDTAVLRKGASSFAGIWWCQREGFLALVVCEVLFFSQECDDNKINKLIVVFTYVMF